MGFIKIPTVESLFTESKYAPCLREFYADWAPEKLGDMHTTLTKFEGKVRSCPPAQGGAPWLLPPWLS